MTEVDTLLARSRRLMVGARADVAKAWRALGLQAGRRVA